MSETPRTDALKKDIGQWTSERIPVATCLETCALLETELAAALAAKRQAETERDFAEKHLDETLERGNAIIAERDQLRAQVANLTAERDALESLQDQSGELAVQVSTITAERDHLMADVVTLRKALEDAFNILEHGPTNCFTLDDAHEVLMKALAAEHPGAPLVEAVGHAREALKKDFDRFTALGRGGWAIDCAEALALLSPFTPKVDQSTESAS